MSEMPPEPGASPMAGFLSPRNLLIIGGVAVLAYLLFFRKSSTGGTSTGGGGTSTTGDISVQPGTQTVNVQAPSTVSTAGGSVNPPPGTPQNPSPNPQPKPPVPSKTKVTAVHFINYTVKPGDTLKSLAERYHVSVAQIAHAPGNVYVPGEASAAKVGKQLGTGAGLKTGMTLHIPQYS